MAANSVVFSDIPPYAVVAGNSAAVVRDRFSRTTIMRMLRIAIAWWDWPEAERGAASGQATVFAWNN